MQKYSKKLSWYDASLMTYISCVYNMDSEVNIVHMKCIWMTTQVHRSNTLWGCTFLVRPQIASWENFFKKFTISHTLFSKAYILDQKIISLIMLTYLDDVHNCWHWNCLIGWGNADTIPNILSVVRYCMPTLIRNRLHKWMSWIASRTTGIIMTWLR